MPRPTILLVHGRSFKPPERELKRFWIDALRCGLARDRPEALPAFTRAHRELVYYGDLSNGYLLSRGETYDVLGDLADRRACHADLVRRGREDFTREAYQRTPGRSAYREFLADTLGAPLSALRLTEGLIARVSPDMAHYWNRDEAFGSEVRATMSAPLKRALRRSGPVLLIAHSLGAIVAYDTLWKFSRTGEYRPEFSDRPIDLWITIGSPLSDPTVRRHLRGSGATGPRRFPANVRRWVNVTAEDDFVAHDETAADDFTDMVEAGLVETIDDHQIYNLAVRRGRSNPHSSAGYLIHPTVTALVADWLLGAIGDGRALGNYARPAPSIARRTAS